MTDNGGHRIAHLLISYLDERERYAERWHGAVRDWPKPPSFPWALDDPVATTDVVDGRPELRPTADVVELPGCWALSTGGGTGSLHPSRAEPVVNGVALAQKRGDRGGEVG
jgi:hypothetical protein